MKTSGRSWQANRTSVFGPDHMLSWHNRLSNFPELHSDMDDAPQVITQDGSQHNVQINPKHTRASLLVKRDFPSSLPWQVVGHGDGFISREKRLYRDRAQEKYS